jgi:hypothetical protein
MLQASSINDFKRSLRNLFFVFQHPRLYAFLPNLSGYAYVEFLAEYVRYLLAMPYRYLQVDPFVSGGGADAISIL